MSLISDPISENVSEDPSCSFIQAVVPFLGSVGMLLNFEALDEVHGIGQGSELVPLPFSNNNFFFSLSTVLLVFLLRIFTSSVKTFCSNRYSNHQLFGSFFVFTSTLLLDLFCQFIFFNSFISSKNLQKSPRLTACLVARLLVLQGELRCTQQWGSLTVSTLPKG